MSWQNARTMLSIKQQNKEQELMENGKYYSGHGLGIDLPRDVGSDRGEDARGCAELCRLRKLGRLGQKDPWISRVNPCTNSKKSAEQE